MYNKHEWGDLTKILWMVRNVCVFMEAAVKYDYKLKLEPDGGGSAGNADLNIKLNQPVLH